MAPSDQMFVGESEGEELHNGKLAVKPSVWLHVATDLLHHPLETGSHVAPGVE